MVLIVKYYIFCVFVTLYFVYANLLEVDVQISENVKAGGSAVLSCLFNCHVNEIFTLKWYRGHREFYRFMPSVKPSIKVFNFTVGGLEVDAQNSNATQVTIRNVPMFLSGQYSCEVTAGDNLTTVSAHSNLYIYDPALFKKPSIEYKKDQHKVFCSGVYVQHPVKKFSTVFYADEDKLSQSVVTYDNRDNVIVLNTRLLDWNNEQSKVIHCEVDLPKITPISSDEIEIQMDTSNADIVFPSTIIVFMGCISRYI